MKSHNSAKGPSQRMLRVGEQIKQIIAETMTRGHFHQEVLINAGHITVSEVRVTPDLKHARAYVTSLSGENMDEILPALNDSAAVFQKDVSRNSNLKFTPKVTFVRDETLAEAQRIDDILRSVLPSKDSSQDEE